MEKHAGANATRTRQAQTITRCMKVYAFVAVWVSFGQSIYRPTRNALEKMAQVVGSTRMPVMIGLGV